jgi:pimeloyl-ACP methyl ester carboxylesterase
MRWYNDGEIMALETTRKAHLLLSLYALPMAAQVLGGCVAHQVYNEESHEYIQQIPVPGREGVEYDLAIIEFDDHGVFWKLEQLEDTLDLIERRNAESERGVFVIPFIHGWKNNADPRQKSGDLVRFREELATIASDLAASDYGTPDRLIGVYLGWRGATSRISIQKELTFWDRLTTAERVVSLTMRETLFRIMAATRVRPNSKCFVVGHSMGGLIVGKTLSPSLTTLLLANGSRGVRMPADLVLLLNPALDALSSWQFIDFLKRSNARLELRRANGEIMEAPGPIIASITSEADTATGRAYSFGRTVSSLFTAFRTDHDESHPSQRHLATHAEGHVDYLVSHRARVEDGEVILERVPGAYNDTPFWIIQVTSDISRDHGDTRNPMIRKLTDQLSQLNRLYEIDVQTWILTTPTEH